MFTARKPVGSGTEDAPSVEYVNFSHSKASPYVNASYSNRSSLQDRPDSPNSSIQGSDFEYNMSPSHSVDLTRSNSNSSAVPSESYVTQPRYDSSQSSSFDSVLNIQKPSSAHKQPYPSYNYFPEPTFDKNYIPPLHPLDTRPSTLQSAPSTADSPNLFIDSPQRQPSFINDFDSQFSARTDSLTNDSIQNEALASEVFSTKSFNQNYKMDNDSIIEPIGSASSMNMNPTLSMGNPVSSGSISTTGEPAPIQSGPLTDIPPNTDQDPDLQLIGQVSSYVLKARTDAAETHISKLPAILPVGIKSRQNKPIQLKPEFVRKVMDIRYTHLPKRMLASEVDDEPEEDEGIKPASPRSEAPEIPRPDSPQSFVEHNKIKLFVANPDDN